MADATNNIDFFGFTGENTVGDVREYFKQCPDDIKVVQDSIKNEEDWYYTAIAEAVFYFALDNYSKTRNELNEDIDFSNSNKDKIVSKNPYIKDLFGVNALNTAKKYKNPTSNRTDDDKFQKDIDATLTKWFCKSRIDKQYQSRASFFAKKCVAIRMLPIYDKRLHNIKSEIEKTEKPRRQFVFTGAPGTGKTYGVTEFAKAYITANGGDTEKQYEFVQFHPSFDYTDFVEGLKPAVIGYDGDKPITHFVRMDGVFKKFCRKAAADKNNLYFFIIDEINRADLSRVFGELMYCLEESYRGAENRISTQYQNLPTYEYVEANGKKIAKETEDDVFAEGFYIPENVVIIGTMNDIDRSVETFDFALRRRFRWINITAKESMKILEERLDGIYKHDDKNNELKKRIEALNKKIGNDPKLGEAFQLGQSYFTKITSTKEVDLKDYFVNELKPILEEYVRGRKDPKEFVKECGQKFTGDNDNKFDPYNYPEETN